MAVNLPYRLITDHCTDHCTYTTYSRLLMKQTNIRGLQILKTNSLLFNGIKPWDISLKKIHMYPEFKQPKVKF